MINEGMSQDVSRKINGLLIDGAKYTANNDMEKAARCYAEVLDIESQKPEPYVLLARCLYRIGLDSNDMFAGGGDNHDEAEDNYDDESEGESESDSESEIENDDKIQKTASNQRLYQFGYEEEEDIKVAPDIHSASKGKEAVPGEVRNFSEEEDITGDGDDDGGNERAAFSATDSFQNYLDGDVFENAMELLYRARIMYTESSPSPDEFPKDLQLRLAEIYDLLGDIEQELEDFSQSVRDYQESIRFYQETHNDELVISIYLKLAEALRWLDTKNDDTISPDQRKEYLQNIIALIQKRIETAKSKDIEEDKQNLEHIEEDLEILKKGKPKGKPFSQQNMMEAILQHALGATKQHQVNDLSKMVKKRKTRK